MKLHKFSRVYVAHVAYLESTGIPILCLQDEMAIESMFHVKDDPQECINMSLVCPNFVLPNTCLLHNVFVM